VEKNIAIKIDEGDVIVGSSVPGESPPTTLFLAGFRIQKYAVTNREYREFIKAGGYSDSGLWCGSGLQWKKVNEIATPAFWDDSSFNSDDQPVTGISFYEASAYCKWVGGRMPTELEWEKACRGNEGSVYPWGESDPNETLANYAPDFVPIARSPVSVYLYPKNESPYGCRQMAGNSFEWCQDYFHFDTPEHRSTEQVVETRPSGRHVLKGGAWTTGKSRIRAAARWSYAPGLRDNILGFRVAFDA